jgi:outer membrane receptor protein involved in Fe transport
MNQESRDGSTAVDLPAAVLGNMRRRAMPTSLVLTALTLATTITTGYAAEPEEVVVTGSRIPRDSNLSSPSPIQTIQSEALKLNGNFNTIDTLNNVAALNNSTTSETSNNGQNVLDLRGLGSERTLVLVNGRRHVSGVEGTQSVEISSIPPALIERVDVVTGGASAVYGADAVTGVVNFILKKDFEGFDIDLKNGISDRGDAEQTTVSAVYGRNFADGRGNLVVALDYLRDTGLRAGDRSRSRNNGIANDDANPDLRFQSGDIDPMTTPNFARFFNFENTGRFPRGFTIPTEQRFITQFTGAFGSAPTLTAAERALIQRAAAAPPRAFRGQHTFAISSKNGVIAPADFSIENGVDTDGNGIQDCLESFVGFSSQGGFGGCFVVDPVTGVRPFRDGLIANNFNGFGGDGIEDGFDRTIIIPIEDRAAININGRFEFTPALTGYVESKFSYTQADNGTPLNTFFDLLFGAPDNPFIPTQLQGLADQAGGLFITRDNTDFGNNRDTLQRRTMRIVAGVEGKLGDSWTYDLSGNYGRFDLKAFDRGFFISDRFNAAIDAVRDPVSGNIVCRSDLDPTAIPSGSASGIPFFDPGFFTFTPGDGQCKPANIFGGAGAISREATDFFTTTVVDRDTIEQTVFNATFLGSSEPWFSLPAGKIGLAFGVEWREETSKSRNSALELGIIPQGAPVPAGTLVDTVSQNGTLGFDGNTKVVNTDGRFDVAEVFTEAEIPVLRNLFLADDLSFNLAYRYSDYSSIGSSDSYSGGGGYAPIPDVRLRGSRSRAVRAPNIFELFSPDQPATFRPVDPCDQAEINSLVDADPAGAAIRAANCAAAGIPVGFADPLSARFSGVSSGNPNLQEETADTSTFGIVLQPRFIPNLAITVDYFDIEIEDAIVAVAAQDIVDNCFDSPNFPNQFCSLFTRNMDPASPQFLGFNFLRQQQLNFGSIETSGLDFSINYAFSIGAQRFTFSADATKQKKLDLFFDPGDPTAVDPELGEVLRPEWSGNARLGWQFGGLSLEFATQYLGKQLEAGASIETFATQFGNDAVIDKTYLYDLMGRYRWSNSVLLFGGVQNLTDEKPFRTLFSAPTSARGRNLFLGVRVSL